MTVKRTRLAARRKAVGFSQDKLAERLQVDRSTIVRWENGDSVPQPWKRVEFAKALRVSADQLDELLTEESPATADADREDVEKTSQPTMLRVLLKQRHWLGYRTFEAQFARAARQLSEREEEPELAKVTLSEATFERWLYGKVKAMPQTSSRRILEHMFGIPVRELLRPVDATNNPDFSLTSKNDRSAAASNNRSLVNPDAIDGLVVGRIPPDSANISVSALIEASTADAAQITMSAGREVINPLTIEQLYEEVCRLSVDYIGSTVEANRQILRRATDLRKALKGLIATNYRKPSQSADIYLMIGLLSGICAYSCLDLNHPDEAMTQARTSFMMGDLIGHDGLRAWALGTRSLIARFQERYPEALGYAREGIQYATSGTAMVRLRCGEGQTLAHMGNAADSIQFLNLAKEAREHVSSPDIASGLFIFSEAKQTYYTGSSLQWLPGEKNAKSAQAESARAIQMFESTTPEVKSPGDVLLARIYLGNSRLTLGEIEGSMDALRPVLDLPLSSRSSWQKKRMRQIVAKLDKASFSGSRLAISARDEISSFVKSP